jgi:hypothetical protein
LRIVDLLTKDNLKLRPGEPLGNTLMLAPAESKCARSLITIHVELIRIGEDILVTIA